MKYNEEQAKRRKLHNQVEDAKGMLISFYVTVNCTNTICHCIFIFTSNYQEI